MGQKEFNSAMRITGSNMAKSQFLLISFVMALISAPVLWASEGHDEKRPDEKKTKNKSGKVYVLDEKPFSPIEIIDENHLDAKHSKNVTILRDPGFTPGGVVPKFEEKQSHPTKPKVAKAPVVPKKTYKFRSVNVKGYHKDPRVDFSQEYLQLDRSDEPLQAQFLPKTFEEEKDL